MSAVSDPNQLSPNPPRQLLVMRHAKSSWNEPALADYDRPLNTRGRMAAPLMGQRLCAAGLSVDVILASPAQRVRETLDLLLPVWQVCPQVIWEKSLYLADVATLIQLLQAMHAQWPRIMVVGHNPGLSQLVGHLTGQYIDMPTAAIAILAHPDPRWQVAIRGHDWTQQHYWTPKD